MLVESVHRLMLVVFTNAQEQRSTFSILRQFQQYARLVGKHCRHAGKAKAKDTGKKGPAAEEVDDIPVEDAGEGQTAEEREEAEQEEAGVCHATAFFFVAPCTLRHPEGM